MLQNNDITYLVGSEDISIRPLVPYEPLVCEFLNDLSSILLGSKEVVAYPDVMAFAFWCRKANIAKFKRDFEDSKIRLGLGLAFHITPSNVPVNFAFSFVFGLLSGNTNIVRVPSKSFPQTDLICAAINHLFENEKHHEIKKMTAFVRYEQNNKITSYFSAQCYARIIWGGDETIKNIRQLPVPVRAVEIAFADRYSFCIIDAPAVLQLNDAELKKLSENFYNDNYLMDQNACSSSHLIVWQGEEKKKAKEKFWAAVSCVVSDKYQLEPVNAVDKYTALCHDAIELNHTFSFKKQGNHVYHLALDKLPDNIDTLRGRYGYFYEYEIDDVNDLAYFVNVKYQTLSYFGVDKSELCDFIIKNRLLGIDRIVPIGQALDINVIWDGYDIVKTLSRIIDVR